MRRMEIELHSEYKLTDAQQQTIAQTIAENSRGFPSLITTLQDKGDEFVKVQYPSDEFIIYSYAQACAIIILLSNTLYIH